MTVVTGPGAGGRPSSLLERQVRKANGRAVKALVLHRMRANDEYVYVHLVQNQALAVERAIVSLEQDRSPG